MSGQLSVRRAAGTLLDLLFPPRCPFCGRLTGSGSAPVCPACEASLPRIPDKLSLRQAGGFPCAVTFYYDGPVQEGIHAMKFGKKSWRAGIFGQYLAQTAAEQLAGEFDTVTFVPISRRRNIQRGFDQSRLLAEAAARSWGISVTPTLRKIRHTPPQSTLTDPKARLRNAQGAYRVTDPRRVEGRRFLLIDDVVTTGSTLSACAGALLAAGAASVVCAALAGGQKPDSPT